MLPSTPPAPLSALSSTASAELPQPPASRGPLVVIAPHPDDETLGAGGVLLEAAARGREVWVVFATSGDAFPWGLHRLRRWRGGRAAAQQGLGGERMREALRATARLGVPSARAVFLGFPDRGLQALATTHFETPLRSRATGVDFVPYASAFRPGAPYTGAEFVGQLCALLRRIRPAVVLTPGPLDSHGDHRATTALVHRALRDHPDVKLLYYLVHSDARWPAPKGYRPLRRLTLPRAYGNVRALQHTLSARQLRAKRDAIHAYATQLRVMGWNLWSFLRRNEVLIPADPALLPVKAQSARLRER